jgi:hypothetical protein
MIAPDDTEVARLRTKVNVLSDSFFKLHAAVQQSDTSDALRRVAREHRERVCVALGIAAQPCCPGCGRYPCSCR